VKIAYVTHYDVSDTHAWSGLASYILETLIEAGFQLEVIANLADRFQLFFKSKKFLYTKILSKPYLRDREPQVANFYAKQVEHALKATNVDVIFSPETKAIAYLQTDKPIVFWTDATFAGMVNFYPDFTNLCAETLTKGNRIEQAALSNCRLAIYASEWAARTAKANYNVDPNKIQVVPFGANHNYSYNLPDIQSWVTSKTTNVCKLLFVGVEWERKGGDDAVCVAEALNKQGLKTELHIVGCKPPVQVPSYARIYGYLSKKNVEERNILDQLFKESHFLILPSKVEAYGIVFAEASSYGLPSLATNVGGISTAIVNGLNGQVFDPNVFIHECTDYILEMISSKEKYYELSVSTFLEYKKRLNWRTAGESIATLLYKYCS
jgi:glycosyltransferase involved in cell wall biosynthesis